MREIVRVGIIVVLGILSLGWAAHAAQLYVSQDGSSVYRTIQGALQDASFGDTIFIAPGTYDERLTLRNGVHLVGSGSDKTIIRHGYGFEEVVRASNMSSGTVEGLTVQRTGALLAAPALLIDAASITVRNCTITGAQSPGIEIRDERSRVRLESLNIVANAAHGVWVHDEARIELFDCTIEGNGGSGILLGAGTSAALTRTTIEANGHTGMVLEASADADADLVTIRNHPQWGIEAHDTSHVRLSSVFLDENAGGGAQFGDASSGEIRDCEIRGGAVGLTVENYSTLLLLSTRIQDVAGTGLLLADSSRATVRFSEIVGCDGPGLVAASSAACEVDHCTVADNRGHGIDIPGDRVTVSNTLVAYNAGYGIHVVPSLPGSPDHALTHNNLWGNDLGDAFGFVLKPSNLQAPPGFVDLSGGDVSLRPDSPCLTAGQLNTPIGSMDDPRREPGLRVDLSSSFTVAGIEMTGRLAARQSESPLDTIEVSALREGDLYSLLVTSSLLGTWGTRTHAEASIGFPERTVGEGIFSLAGRFDADAVLDGRQSWIQTTAQLEAAGSKFNAQAQLGAGWPSPSWTQSGRLELGDALRVRLSAQATNWIPNALALGAQYASGGAENSLHLDAEIAWGSERTATGSAIWSTPDRRLAATATAYLAAPGAVDVTLQLNELPLHFVVTANAVFRDHGFQHGSLAVDKAFNALDAQIELGLGQDEPPRLSLALHADVSSWLTRPPNLPPIPFLTVAPEEPEALEPIVFDGTLSTDPEGDLASVWWDFGDGRVAEGASITHTYASPGTYDVVLTVGDGQGTTTALVSPLTVWPANTAPSAAFVWGPVTEAGTTLPRSPRTGDSLRLDASSSTDRDGRIREYMWDLDSDGQFELLRNEPTITIPPLAAGAHPITLRVVDDDSRSSAIMHVVTVSERRPPTAEFTHSPATPSIHDPVRFIDRSVDADGSIEAWEWSFDDGGHSRESEPYHRFAGVGTYDVSLTVTDNDGLTATATQPVEVALNPQVVPVQEIWALVIGISDYDEVKDLAYGRPDAEAIAAWLLKSGVSPDHVRLLTDHETAPDAAGWFSRRATLLNVREGLGWLRRTAARDDLVIVYFSGHGYQGLDDGEDEGDGVDEFFALVDTRAAAMDDTALRDDEFGRFLDRIPSDHVLVLFDGCYSGGLARSLPSGHRPTGPVDLFHDFSLEGRLVLAASSETQDAFESPALEHGVFTHFVLAGLRGAADLNYDEQITVWELYEYVAAQVPPFVQQERGESQQPQLIGEGEARVVVAARPRVPVAAFSYWPTLPVAGSPVAFFDESVLDAQVTSVSWSFGDGEGSQEQAPVHTYEEPGTYAVSLTLDDELGRSHTAVLNLPIAAAGTVIEIATSLDRMVVSLGSLQGVSVGETLEVLDPLTGDVVATIEALELLPGVGASCRVTDAAGEAALGYPVRRRSK